MSAAAKEADEGYAKFHSISPAWAWQFNILRATAALDRGMNNDVLTILDSEKAPCPAGELAIKKKWLEGQAYTQLHKFPEADAKFAEAEQLCGDSEILACADVLRGRGVLEMSRARYAEAQRLFNRILPKAVASGNHFWQASALLDMTWSAEELTHFDEALDTATEARSIALSGKFLDLAQTALGDIGWAYYKLGDLEKAGGLLSDAAGEAGKLGDASSEVGWLIDAGYVDMDENRLPLAEQIFLHSSELARKIESPGDLLDSLTALAYVSEQTGKLDEAKKYADQALAMARAAGNGRDIVYPLLVEGRVAARRDDAATAETDFRDVAKSADTPVFLKWEAERSLARLYEDENQFKSADAEYRTSLTTFETARCGLHEGADSRLPFLSNAARIYEDYVHFLVLRGRTNDALRVADYARARTLAEGLGVACKPSFSPDPLSATEIARRAGGTILFYALGQQHSYVWVITLGEARIFPLAANQSEVDSAVERYRQKLEGPREILEASNDGSVLYQMLIAPAGDFLKQALSRSNIVFIVPDAGLNSLNFETLMPQPNRYWIEDVNVTNASSLRLMAGVRTLNRLNGRLLLVGDPATPDAGPENQYPKLPNAAAQMQSIEKYFAAGQQEVFTADQASPAAYLHNHPEEFSYIHFVAHGTASRMNPLDSAIILSREEKSSQTANDDSFKLYARDIIGTPRLRAELVTISACYSTGNRTYSGEGLVGLSWAFLRAGAHNVVAALWDVSDASTPQLIDEFYRELKNGKPPNVALRKAKLSLLHGGTFHSPFYWAPFQLYSGS
jgi:CHAT domain-containing protein